MKATLDEWFEIVSRGTSGDQVHDILYSWKKDRANFAALQAELDAARARIAELETDDELNRKLIGSITKQFDKARARIAELEAEADAADACAIAQDGRIAELEAARRWIPVGERLPDRGQTVYGWINPVSYLPGHGKEMTYMPMLNPGYPWRSTWDMATYSALDITHWQPLPAVPEVEK